MAIISLDVMQRLVVLMEKYIVLCAVGKEFMH